MKTMNDVTQLRRAGRYLDALRALDNATSADLDQLSTRILKADLLEMVGHPSQATSIAERALKSTRISQSDRSRCLFIISKVLFEDGKTDDALSHLQRASSLAQKSGDLELLCWIFNKMMLVVAERSGPDSAAPIVAEIRRTTMRLGDPQMAALTHMYMGEMEGKRGFAGKRPESRSPWTVSSGRSRRIVGSKHLRKTYTLPRAYSVTRRPRSKPCGASASIG